MHTKDIKKIVLAYSGGLDTSAIIPWLKEHYGNCEVVAFVADVGQSREDLEGVEQKALRSGASECHVVDLREEFIKDYVYPVLKTGALYEGSYLLGTSMARPIIAKAQVELALKVGADALAHGATGKGNDQVRFESTYTALAPQLKVVAPWREWDLRSREVLLDYLKARDIPTTATLEKIYSRDENAWHISTEGGVLESTWNVSNKDCWVWTVDPEEAPDEAELVSVMIEKGEVVGVNGKVMSPYQCLEALNILGVKHGIGRIDIVENRLVGMKSRGCYETPGGTIMMAALRGVEQLVLDRDSFKWRQQLGLEMSYVVYDGRWFAPLRHSIQAAAETLAADVSGEVVLKLYKGQVTAIQKRSTNSLYSEAFATFGEDEVYDHSHAAGFIRLYSLPSRIRALNSKE
ncbi:MULTISPECIES: argininosuccinate synthase [Photorhabdus]|uniref:argininosuccinate synthase n=1 Tax=Photorhabdus TaxID=29487 RepID=UPI00073370C9|nr:MULTISPECIES: argininosuccinate synthase [Photorhabdus]AWK44249.1 argininosuccinate synthase [Photorhabdus laumondii subsp. laumondii]AXG44933.1 argininosuccinate synthase [Photorhabdus laumondii subsp. laumondii]KTL63071.1 argininosuccinate synthase [Photorhabdus laumondii subsp. laumondii]MCC8389595.1 argininosuccinate synthase [Photorhabdus laumondii]MCZ1247864.1 argininosuccinate synthase [Photorhabdus laumondii subsp. laumondii]